MDKSQKVAFPVTFLIMSQILIDFISHRIHIKQDQEFLDLAWTNKSKTKNFIGCQELIKKLDLHLLSIFNLITFAHPKVQQTEHSSNIKLQNT